MEAEATGPEENRDSAVPAAALVGLLLWLIALTSLWGTPGVSRERLLVAAIGAPAVLLVAYVWGLPYPRRATGTSSTRWDWGVTARSFSTLCFGVWATLFAWLFASTVSLSWFQALEALFLAFPPGVAFTILRLRERNAEARGGVQVGKPVLLHVLGWLAALLPIIPFLLIVNLL